ncbi:MAG: hypothetical protein FWC64_09020 [Treponema sp.]|nr:hypothetical protein [Treponema sp.]
MKNNVKLFGIIAATAVIGLLLTGCATNIAGVRSGWNTNQVPLFATGKYIYIRDHTILGPVQIEGTTTRIIRLGIPFTGIEAALFSFTNQQVTYANLLAQAQRQFPNANAVTSVQIDSIHSNILFFFSTRRYIATGLAIEVWEEAHR